MDSIKLASGDNNLDLVKCPRPVEEESTIDRNVESVDEVNENNLRASKQEDITYQMINDNEIRLKNRIAHCRNIIDTLKLELNEEKAKLGKETKSSQQYSVATEPLSMYSAGYHDVSKSDNMIGDLMHAPSIYSACVDDKLNYDENLMEYEKQLQKYQTTLNMAQIEKKNAIRKQMLTKAYRLKLLEVENQCNIELLRVKQSLQCLEPLKMIASKWNINSDNTTYDTCNFELLPLYPELGVNSTNDVNFKEEFDAKTLQEKTESCAKNDSSSDC